MIRTPGAQPPLFVIRATSSYKATRPTDLSFKPGDFFYVTDTSKDGVYIVSDPVRGVRGMVPRHQFQVLERTHNTSSANNGGPAGGLTHSNGQNGRQNDTRMANGISTQPHSSNITSPHSNTQPPLPGSKSPGGRRPMSLMATVMYDFAQEKTDELPASMGDSIVVLARSNHDWVLAKPIGRVARPGLIPVTYIEVREPKTGAVIKTEDIRDNKIGLPSVQEWKAMTRKYVDNIIPLGVLSTSTSSSSGTSGPKSADFNTEQTRRQQNGHTRNANSQPMMSNGHLNLSQPTGNLNGEAFSSQVQDSAGSHSHSKTNTEWDPSHGRKSNSDNRVDQGPLTRRGSSMTRDGFGSALKGGGGSQESSQVRASRSPNQPEARTLSHEGPHTTYHSVGIRRYELQSDGSYLFHLRLFVTAPSDQGTITTERILYRYYEDFHQLHMALMQQFPTEAGRQVSYGSNSSSRTLPFLPKPTSYVDEEVTRTRMMDLDTYLKQLVGMPAHVVRSETVDDFLNTWDWDQEWTRDGRQIATLIAEAREEERQARMQPASQTSLDARPVGPPSPPRSNAGAGGNPGTISMSSGSSGSNASRDWGSYYGSAAAPASRGQQNGQNSTTQQPSPTSSRGSNGLHSIFNTSSSAILPSTIKIKVEYNDDMVALKADPSTLSLPWLHSTIAEKLFGTRDFTGFRMYVQVDGEWEPIEDEEALQEGVRDCGGKLIVHVRL